ncbi:uncharacterized protein TrAFT101_003500 [Trichoderma asperellum]|uniref:Uncharacterized protein n=1 Tax=Trichoderma asperellum (strain ATCC 204424 / CBS 433.97 / NBRC 101777) TaxID=1042311 RepID=A0A2T3ZQH6_TRIA4|nr:hypothetical protein M441DRAFT_53739 [Trichoderma asperellum CBS 433.97]PTB47059.1 hypothetical protein M441DRAFT_53739 [Trichoderma asperellum CBS 433.97]UKZ87728.1 hypothetical protein TrAFT101_003500 [Trichoderma asperellum]
MCAEYGNSLTSKASLLVDMVRGPYLPLATEPYHINRKEQVLGSPMLHSSLMGPAMTRRQLLSSPIRHMPTTYPLRVTISQLGFKWGLATRSFSDCIRRYSGIYQFWEG